MQFLSEPHIGALSVDAGEGGARGPLTVPVWYAYERGQDLLVLTERDSRKAQLIAKAGRFSLLAERVDPTVRYVSVEGPVTETRTGTRDDLRRMTARYLAPERVADYLEFADREHGEYVLIHMRPEHWLSADLGPQ
nr:pyridoxamine 5'-phosphate oxidase family protein [Streptomyces sp. HNM0574]